MDIVSAIRAVTEHRDLSGDEMRQAMSLIMTGEATPAQIGGFLVGLRMKGETVEEIAAAATVMRDLATKVEVSPEHLVDTCGTGGDGSGTFNISTASAIVAAGAGARVAKHGNRAVSSQSGSADVLMAAGVNVDLTPAQVAHCIHQARVGFLFAPKHHGAMKHAIGPRREMGVRTVFNLLGPLTNPAAAPNQILGVFSKAWVEPMARVLSRLGSRHVLVVHAEDGMDELSISGPTHVAELSGGEVQTYMVEPEQFGFPTTPRQTLVVHSAQESWSRIQSVLANEAGPARDVVAFNAGAAVYVSGLAASLAEGVDQALGALASGAAARCMETLVATSQA